MQAAGPLLGYQEKSKGLLNGRDLDVPWIILSNPLSPPLPLVGCLFLAATTLLGGFTGSCQRGNKTQKEFQGGWESIETEARQGEKWCKEAWDEKNIKFHFHKKEWRGRMATQGRNRDDRNGCWEKWDKKARSDEERGKRGERKGSGAKW